jgi:hypothetical protein
VRPRSLPRFRGRNEFRAWASYVFSSLSAKGCSLPGLLFGEQAEVLALALTTVCPQLP